MVHAAYEVLLPRCGAGSGGGKVEGPVGCVWKGLVVEKRERLLAQRRFGQDVADDADVERIFEHDGLPGARVHESAEIAAAHRLRRDNPESARRALRGVTGLPVEEEKRFVRALVQFG